MRLAFVGDDHDLRRAGDEVDADFACEQLLRGGYVDVSRTHNAISARDCFRSECERRDCVRAADQKYARVSEQRGGSEDLARWLSA
jgi:hypothetical protein